MFYVYVLKINNGEDVYIGYTSDLKRRLSEHKNKRPKLVYYEAYKDKRDACVRELQLKKRGQSVRWLKQRAKYSLS